MSFKNPVSGRKSYKKELTSTSSTNSTNQLQHEEDLGTAEISSDESENEDKVLGSPSQEENETLNENDDSLEDSEIVNNTFASATCESPIILESADIKQREHSAGASYRRREPSASYYPPSSPRRSASIRHTNLSSHGGPHQDCVGSSPLRRSHFMIAVLIPFLIIFPLKFVTSSTRNRCETLAKLNETLPKDIFKVVNVSVTATLFNDSSKPTVLMFLQEDEENANKIVDKIADSIIGCFDFDAKKETLDLNYFESIDDPGSAIELVKAKLSKGGVVVVPNVQEIRGDVARAFHSICELNPALVQKLFVLFTLTPLKQYNVTENNPTNVADKTLKSRWRNLEDYELNPLVTRVTDHVVWLRPIY